MMSGDADAAPLCWTLLPPCGHFNEPQPLFCNDRLIFLGVASRPPLTYTHTSTTSTSPHHLPHHHNPSSLGWINIAGRYITCCYGDQLVDFFFMAFVEDRDMLVCRELWRSGVCVCACVRVHVCASMFMFERKRMEEGGGGGLLLKRRNIHKNTADPKIGDNLSVLVFSCTPRTAHLP